MCWAVDRKTAFGGVVGMVGPIATSTLYLESVGAYGGVCMYLVAIAKITKRMP